MHVNRSEVGDTTRGRTLQRASKYRNPLAKAESRPRYVSDAAIEVDMRPIRKHTHRRSSPLSHVDNSVDQSPNSEDFMLEPCPHTQVCSGVANFLKGKQNVPTACDTAGSFASSEMLSSSGMLGAQLPTEILHQIYSLLTPADFNSARHVCRVWFISSLEPSLLMMMLKRGGWSSYMNIDLAINRISEPNFRINEAWLMSKRIARECTLGPDWTGNGVSGDGSQNSSSRRSGFIQVSTVDFTEVPVRSPEISSPGIIFTASICGKFLMAANGCVVYIYEINRKHDSEEGSVPSPGSLRPVTGIICPRRVLACSMDTSSHRYAVAALLDGRVGLVCEITPSHIASGTTSESHNNQHNDPTISKQSTLSTMEPQDGESSQEHIYPDSSSSDSATNQPTMEPHFVFRGIATAVTSAPTEQVWHGSVADCISKYEEITEGKGYMPPQGRCLVTKRQLCTTLPHFQQNQGCATSMPIEAGHRSLYRNLCSDDDPPRSVAICPQRRCVAFGCSAGIELHWVDALTGQDLNRWFPLTAPSDYLYFLPPRAGIDTAKKLRLISSTVRPAERAAISQRFAGGITKNSPFWHRSCHAASGQESDADVDSEERLVSRLRARSRDNVFTGRIDCSDHYRAVPLSDGYHVLFMDPATGLLCLGSDAPAGGPTKLLRKIWFQGPEGKGSPVAYAGSMDMASCVRVVAAYGSGSEQSIWFFSVPGDVFAANRGLPFVLGGSYLQAWSQGEEHDNRNANWVDWWPDQSLHEWLSNVQDSIPGALPRTIWPVKIRGQEIGTCPALVDIAVQSGSSMTIWAFSRDGLAKAWRINDGTGQSIRGIRIMRDGTVREFGPDSKGDMTNTSFDQYDSQTILAVPLRQASFDGTAFSSRAISQTAGFIQGCGRIHHYDADGDVIMEDPHDPESSPLYNHQRLTPGCVEAVAFLYHRDGNLYRSSHRSGRSYESIGSDFVDGLTGVTRIDAEIR